MKKPDLLQTYLINILLLLIFGMAWTLFKYEMNSMRFTGVIIAVGSCAIFNLINFIPALSLPVRLLLPGAVSILLFVLLVQGSSVERTFFVSFGMINLLIGLLWLVFKWAQK